MIYYKNNRCTIRIHDIEIVSLSECKVKDYVIEMHFIWVSRENRLEIIVYMEYIANNYAMRIFRNIFNIGKIG